MNDIFNIFRDTKVNFQEYLKRLRGTGRSSFLARTVKDGDIVVFVNTMQAKHFNFICQRLNPDVKLKFVTWNIMTSIEIPHQLRGLKMLLMCILIMSGWSSILKKV